MTCSAAAPVLIELACQWYLWSPRFHHMAPILKKRGTKLNLVFALGYVLVFKSTRFDLAGNIGDIQLDLEHQNGNILLRITFRKGEQKVFFNDRAYTSLRDG